MEKTIAFHDLVIILCGIAMGTIARFVTLRIDTRQNPSYPTGVFINIVIGMLASALGSVAIPALLDKEFTAVTFIALAIQHFREVRKTEKDSLEDLEKKQNIQNEGPLILTALPKPMNPEIIYLCLPPCLLY